MKIMNHAEYAERVKTMSYNALLYTARDAKEAAETHPSGENAGYYLDEMHYCAAELKRRDDELRDAYRRYLASRS